MKTCAVKELFEAVVRLRSLDPATASLSTAQKGKIAELVNDAVETAWTFEYWPEAMAVEQRYYRPVWDTGDLWAKDDEVYYDEKYYVSLQDGNTGKQPDVETAWWAEVAEDGSFVRTIDFDQAGETEIGAIDTGGCVFASDPRAYPGLAPLEDVEIVGRRIVVRTARAPTRPWLKFRPPPPEYSWTEWSAVTGYSAGDLVFLDAYGESYRALAASTGKNPYSETEYWEPVGFPVFLKRYVKHAVNAMLMREDEGRFKSMGEAEKMLDEMADRLVEQQVPRQRRARFRGR